MEKVIALAVATLLLVPGTSTEASAPVITPEVMVLASIEDPTPPKPLNVTATRGKVKAPSRATRSKNFAKNAMLYKYNWGKKQYKCLVDLWEQESSWNHKADNPNSSAYGIPQALPGNKMKSAGRDWKTNPETQIRWGLAYIDARYGSPCQALDHHINNNWY